jgi:hypothetical protein
MIDAGPPQVGIDQRLQLAIETLLTSIGGVEKAAPQTVFLSVPKTLIESPLHR